MISFVSIESRFYYYFLHSILCLYVGMTVFDLSSSCTSLSQLVLVFTWNRSNLIKELSWPQIYFSFSVKALLFIIFWLITIGGTYGCFLVTQSQFSCQLVRFVGSDLSRLSVCQMDMAELECAIRHRMVLDDVFQGYSE